MEILVAKYLHGQDESGYMYGDSLIRPDNCPICRNRLKDIPNTNYVVKKKKANLLTTYDHYTIVSQQFRDFCDENEYAGLEFIPFPKSNGFYFFRINKVYQLDYEKGKTRFINLRDCCGSYDEIISPPRYKSKDYFPDSEDFICRSEYRFSSYAFKDYFIIIGLETFNKLKQIKMKGLYYGDVFQ